MLISRVPRYYVIMLVEYIVFSPVYKNNVRINVVNFSNIYLFDFQNQFIRRDIRRDVFEKLVFSLSVISSFIFTVMPNIQGYSE